MAVLDTLIKKMTLNDQEDEYYDDDYDMEDEYVEDKPKKKPFARVEEPEDDYQEEKPRAKQSPKVTAMKQPKRGVSGMEVCVIKPTTVEDAREITETLLTNRTVVLNLEGLDVDVAQRIIDFASGACYSLNGSLQKISSYIFVLGPSSVDITGDLQNILGGATPSVRAGY